MTGVFSETGYGGVYYGSAPTAYARKYPRTAKWLREDHQLRDNIRIASTYFAADFANAGSQVERNEVTELANEHITDLIMSHMPVDVLWEQNPPSWGWLIPTPELVGKWTGTAVPFMQELMDHEWTRTILKTAIRPALYGAFGWGMERLGSHLVKADFPRAHEAYRTSKTAIRYVGALKFGWEFNQWMNDVKNISYDVWKGTLDEKQGVDPVRDTYSYYNLEHGENRMPYNRRTGQWYPARRYGGGTYNRRYRRYGNSRYSGGYSPRRRRYSGSRW